MRRTPLLSLLSLTLILQSAWAEAQTAATDSTTAQPRNELLFDAAAWAAICSHDSLRPLLSYANSWGQYTLYNKGEGGLMASLHYKHQFRSPRLDFRAGIRGVLNTEKDRIALQELYADFKLAMFEVKLGKERYSPVATNLEPLSQGSFILSHNAPPVPRVWVGILDFWSIPMPKRWPKNILQIRGGISLGLLDDNGEQRFTDHILFHEKFVGARLGAYYVKPYVEFYHSVMMGGTNSDGFKYPIEFFRSFVGKGGGDKMKEAGLEAEVTNAAGAHQGMWNIGFDIETKPINATLFFQQPRIDSKKPFYRGGSIDPGFARDFAVGLHMTINRFRPIHRIVAEYFSTVWQGGSGLPDPYFDNEKGKHYVWPTQYVGPDGGDWNVDILKRDVFSDKDVADWEALNGPLTQDNVRNFMADICNHGLDFGGRNAILTNYCYPQGWTNRGLSMSTAVLLTDDQVLKFLPLIALQPESTGTQYSYIRFPVGAVRSINIGLAGDALGERLKYSLQITGTSNHGNLHQFYTNPWTGWDEYADYFFRSPKREVYSRLDVSWLFDHDITLGAMFALDKGDMYDSFAFRLQASYRLARRR